MLPLTLLKKQPLNFLTFLVLLSACAQKTTEESGKHTITTDTLKVEVSEAAIANFKLETNSNGIAHSQHAAKVPFQTAGLITSCLVNNGKLVQKNTLLAITDTSAAFHKLEQAKLNLAKAEIELESILLGRSYTLTDTAHIPKKILDNVKLRSGYQEAWLAYREAQRELNNCYIKAPISGMVANLQAKPHHHSSEFEYVCEILDTRQMLVEFHILEQEVGLVEKGLMVNVQPFSHDTLSMPGHISSINPSVDEHGMVLVQALVNNNTEKLINGMNVRVMVQKVIPNQLVLPKEAVVIRQGKEVVFTYSNGMAMWNYVKTGLENNNEICILEGLNPGDTIIIEGNLHLAHETPVRIETAQ